MQLLRYTDQVLPLDLDFSIPKLPHQRKKVAVLELGASVIFDILKQISRHFRKLVIVVAFSWDGRCLLTFVEYAV